MSGAMAAGTITTRTAEPARPVERDALEQAYAAPAAARRDVALDLLRGLAMVILVVNHIHLESVLEPVTRAFLSAAEVLVAVSGIITGMVFGRRWLLDGARVTTRRLLERARTLYVASVVVVALVGLLTLVPGLATDVLAVSPRVGIDAYAYDGALRTVLAVLTLEAGPWQFNILGFFIAMLVLAPVLLWALERGRWHWVLLASWTVFALARLGDVDVLPAQSERPFPLLVWQVLFVTGMVVGWHRERIAGVLRRRRRAVLGGVLAAAAVGVAARSGGPVLDALMGWTPSDRLAWRDAHLDKTTLDPLRLLGLGGIAGAVYLGLRRWEALARRTIGRVLLPLGRNSFYVFIVHVFLCLAIASLPVLSSDGGLGPVWNAVVQLACLGLLVVMVQRRVLFRWIPR